MIEKKDWCTSFPEYWYRWKTWYSWEKVYIGDCCKQHDENCSTKRFIKCLSKRSIVGRYVITAAAASACLLRYGKI